VPFRPVACAVAPRCPCPPSPALYDTVSAWVHPTASSASLAAVATAITAASSPSAAAAATAAAAAAAAEEEEEAAYSTLLATGASHRPSPHSPLRSSPRSPLHTSRDSPEGRVGSPLHIPRGPPSPLHIPQSPPSPLHIPRGPPTTPRNVSRGPTRLTLNSSLGSRESPAPRTPGAAARAGTADLSPPRGWAADSPPPGDSSPFGWAVDNLSLGGSVARGWAADGPSRPLTAIPADVPHVDSSGPASGRLKVRIGSATAWQSCASPTVIAPSAATPTERSGVATPGAAAQKERPRTKGSSRRTRKPMRVVESPFLSVGL
jgi:hypothetical protein